MKTKCSCTYVQAVLIGYRKSVSTTGHGQHIPSLVGSPTSNLSAQLEPGTWAKRHKEPYALYSQGQCLGNLPTIVDTFAQLVIQTQRILH